MKRPLLAAVVASIAAAFFGIACAEKSPAERTVTESSSETNTSVNDSLQEPSVAAESSEQAYERVRREINKIERSPLARRDVGKAIEQIESKLMDFIKEYPETEEARDATLQLGILFSNMQQPEKAIKHLKEYISTDANGDKDKLAFAHYSLAESYKNSGQYDSAKKHYQIILDKYSAANNRLITMTRTNLEDLDVARNLALGNDPIPFEVVDLKGNPLSIEKLKGKVVLLDFWATWCVPCLQEMPNVKRIYKKYQREGFEIIGISLDSNRQSLKSYIKKNDIKWPQYFDGKSWNNAVAQKYRIRSIPATFLLDRKGKIRYKSIRGSKLEQAVEELIKAK